MKKIIASIVLASVVGISSASAQLTATSTLAFESEYVFRGIKQYGPAIQPSIDLSHPLYEGDAYLGFWGSYGVNNFDNSYSETDFYLGYSQAITDIVSIDAGYTYYGFFEGGPGIDRFHEIYLGFSADYLELNPSIYGYWNFSLDAYTIETSIGHSFDLGEHVENLALDLSGYLGFADSGDINTDQFPGSPEDGYTYWGITTDFVYTINEVASASIGVRYAGNNNGRVGGFNVEPQEDMFWWGLSTSFGF